MENKDNTIWDIASIFHRRNTNEKLDIPEVNRQIPKLLAVAITAWHEENVPGPVAENMVVSIQYPISRYHIFSGVYPNGPAAISVAKELEAQFDNVLLLSCA